MIFQIKDPITTFFKNSCTRWGNYEVILFPKRFLKIGANLPLILEAFRRRRVNKSKIILLKLSSFLGKMRTCFMF